jgi:zinc-ribbon domain
MFCERCGFKLVEGQRFCSSCGKPVGISLVPLERQGKVQRNIQVLAILWLVAGALNLVIGFGLFTVGRIIFGTILANTAIRGDGFTTVAPLVRSIMVFIGCFVIVKALLGLTTGLGLLQRQTWARPLAIVMSFFEILHIPLGTALGIYTLVVLLPGEAAVEYDQLAKAA